MIVNRNLTATTTLQSDYISVKYISSIINRSETNDVLIQFDESVFNPKTCLTVLAGAEYNFEKEDIKNVETIYFKSSANTADFVVIGFDNER
ncbi:hypothetical protein [Acetivibrio cellulolyticus]|uniref:hypothetical protein n=1 Tax=Acetivibrio cellulolyticus TaxID=35830 RepID=UPI0001E2C29B|nr:hypothetical protein [Acetivibrio cellulolyticus]